MLQVMQQPYSQEHGPAYLHFQVILGASVTMASCFFSVHFQRETKVQAQR